MKQQQNQTKTLQYSSYGIISTNTFIMWYDSIVFVTLTTTLAAKNNTDAISTFLDTSPASEYVVWTLFACRSCEITITITLGILWKYRIFQYRYYNIGFYCKRGMVMMKKGLNCCLFLVILIIINLFRFVISK